MMRGFLDAPFFPELEELDERGEFRFPERTVPPGIVCWGGNLSPGMLLSAYRQGIFPWYSDGEPITWWRPDPRFVLLPANLHVSRSMQKSFRQRRYSLTVDAAFPEVIARCSRAFRPGQSGTWITDAMIAAYVRLHELGYAHSAEAWDDEGLAGGCYGVSVGNCFFGESMFHLRPDASKAAFISLAWKLFEDGVAFVDSQVHTDYLESLGATHLPRREYLALLARHRDAPTRKGSWAERFPDFPASKKMNALFV